MPTKFSEEKEKEIIRLYKEGMNQKEIGKLYNTYNTSIKRVLERNNVPKRDRAHDRRSVNKNPFEDLSSKEVQYWLGYLAADGNVNDLSQKNNRISLDTNLDPEHLEKYKKFLETNKKIYKLMYNKEPSLKKHPDRTCYKVSYYSRPFIVNIMVDLYNSSPVYLQRKYNKFRSFYSSLIG